MTLTVMDRKLFLAPIGPAPQRVLDLATGTGLWAIDFGKHSSRSRLTKPRPCVSRDSLNL